MENEFGVFKYAGSLVEPMNDAVNHFSLAMDTFRSQLSFWLEAMKAKPIQLYVLQFAICLQFPHFRSRVNSLGRRQVCGRILEADTEVYAVGTSDAVVYI